MTFLAEDEDEKHRAGAPINSRRLKKPVMRKIYQLAFSGIHRIGRKSSSELSGEEYGSSLCGISGQRTESRIKPKVNDPDARKQTRRLRDKVFTNKPGKKSHSARHKIAQGDMLSCSGRYLKGDIGNFEVNKDIGWAPPLSWAVVCRCSEHEHDIRCIYRRSKRADGKSEEQVPPHKKIVYSDFDLNTFEMDYNNREFCTYEDLEFDPDFSSKIRIYSRNGTVSFLCRHPESMTVKDISRIILDKMADDTIKRFNILVWVCGIERVMSDDDRPLLLQRRLLERAGYTKKEIGKLEDPHKFSCYYRFLFACNMARSDSTQLEEMIIAHNSSPESISLAAMDLSSIPLFLYRFSASINTLNLSSNHKIINMPVNLAGTLSSLTSVLMRNNSIKSFPSSLLLIPTLKVIDLSMNKIACIDGLDFGNLKHLTKLDISANQLKKIPAKLTQLCKFLEYLDFSNNLIKEIPYPFFENASHLTYLNLSWNEIEGPIPESIGYLKSISILDLSFNKFSGPLPEGFTNFKNISKIDLTSNTLGLYSSESVERAFEILSRHKSLEWISLRANFLRIKQNTGALHDATLRISNISYLSLSYQAQLCKSAFPSIQDLTSTLSYLDLRSLKISSLPSNFFSCLPALVKLDVSHNCLKRLPRFSSNSGPSYVSKISELFLGGNCLEQLPNDINTLVNLKVLEVQFNRLETLPVEIWGCNLKSLNITSNRISSLPKPNWKSKSENSVSSNSKSGLGSSLTNLRLTDNKIGNDIWNSLFRLPNLRILYCASNRISDISMWFQNDTGGPPWYSKLQELHLGCNSITVLPCEIELIKSLKWLFLNGNGLKTIPGELSKLQKLELLDLASQMTANMQTVKLHYNTTNWPYEWNWNWNLDLKYLNLSGNKRLEIKDNNVTKGQPHSTKSGGALVSLLHNSKSTNVYNIYRNVIGNVKLGPLENELPTPRSLGNFDTLINLRSLGLMDVTYLSDPPEETPNRRIRTTNSEIPLDTIPDGHISYYVADHLARSMKPECVKVEDLWLPRPPSSYTDFSDAAGVEVWDLVVPNFRNRNDEALFAIFEGGGTEEGARVARFLCSRFADVIATELDRININEKKDVDGVKKGTSSDEAPGTRTSGEVKKSWKGAKRASQHNDWGASSGKRDLHENSQARAHSEKLSLQNEYQDNVTNLGSESSEMEDSHKNPNILSSADIKMAIRTAFLEVNRMIAMEPKKTENGVSNGQTSDSCASRIPSRRQNQKAAPFHQHRKISLNTGTPSEVYPLNEIIEGDTSTQAQKHAGAHEKTFVFQPESGISNLMHGASAVVVLFCGADKPGMCRVFTANVGYCAAVISRNGGIGELLTQLHKVSDYTRVRSESYHASFLKKDCAQEPFEFLDSNIRRVKMAGGRLSQKGALDGGLKVVRSFGYYPMLGIVNSNPYIRETVLDFGTEEDSLERKSSPKENGGDEFILVFSSSLMDAYRMKGSPEDGVKRIVSTAFSAMVDKMKRPEGKRDDDTLIPISKSSATGRDWSMAAMKVRDIAIASTKSSRGGLVMVLGLRDISKNACALQTDLDSIPDQSSETHISFRRQNELLNSPTSPGRSLGSPPVGTLALVFTDIKNSTQLWEDHPVAMQKAIRMHHKIMRELIKETDGYEVKTKGDSFMISFPSVNKAIECCVMIQKKLLLIEWPKEIVHSGDYSGGVYYNHACESFYTGKFLDILEAAHQEYTKAFKSGLTTEDIRLEGVEDDKSAPRSCESGLTRIVLGQKFTVIFKGLSVRIGIHYGLPLCEMDPITYRMDYHGPMVNRASRVSGVSNGGQILLSLDALNCFMQQASFTKDHTSFPRSQGPTFRKSTMGPIISSFSGLRSLCFTKERTGSKDELPVQKLLYRPLGIFKLRGLEASEVLFELYSESLGARSKFYERTATETIHVATASHVQSMLDPTKKDSNEHTKCQNCLDDPFVVLYSKLKFNIESIKSSL